MIQRPTAAVEVIASQFLSGTMATALEQVFQRDLGRKSQFGGSVIGRAPDMDFSVAGKPGGGKEFRAAFIHPARHCIARARDQEMVRVFVQQDGHRPFELAGTGAHVRHESHRSSRTRDVETADILRSGQFADLSFPTDSINGDTIGRTGRLRFPSGYEFHCRMVALEHLGEATHVFLAVVGINDEMIRFGDMPVGLCRHGER